MTETTRIYYEDAYCASFTARVVAHGTVDGRPAVALDQSAFYPEGGGQPADRGTLNGLAVIDVQAAESTVWHLLASPEDLTMLPCGAEVQGAIAWERRFDHMQQHCGQHLLSAAFLTTSGLSTLAFHLSDGSVTIDLDTPALQPAQVRAAEALANQVVWECRPVEARFVTATELAKLPLRKPARVGGPVRVVRVADFDYSACGGTHPHSTGGVGLISVLRWSRQRGGTRVEFACGGRALRELRRLAAAAAGAAASLSVGVDELAAAAERAVAAQKAMAREVAASQATLDASEALRCYAVAVQRGPARVVRLSRADLPLARLRSLAQAVAAQPGGVALIGAPGTPAQLIVACAPSSGCDARMLLAAGLAVLEGRGGGNAQLAQGGGPRTERLEAALDAMLATLGSHRA